MNCERAENLMMDFLYREKSAEMPKGFFGHLEDCQRCSTLLNDLKSICRLVRDIPDITDTSRETIQDFPGASRKANKPVRWYWATAAIVVLAVLSVLAALNSSIKYQQGVIALRLGPERETTVSEYAVTLSGSSSSEKDIEGLLRYINYLENRRNLDQNVLTDQIEILANTTLHEFRKRDEMFQWLINNYPQQSGQPSGQINPVSSERR